MSKKISIGLSLLLVSSQLAVSQEFAKAQTDTQTPIVPATATRAVCPAQLGKNIDGVVNRLIFSRARWGILIQPLASNKTLYSREAQKYFVPASVTKVLTTAAALQSLGANFRIRTSVVQDANGVLRVIGRGDPSINDAQLTALAKQLKGRGINNIKQLMADDTYIKGDIVNSTWQWEDVQSDYGAPIGSFMVNENLFKFNLIPQAVGRAAQISWVDVNESRQWITINQALTASPNQPNSINVNRDLTGKILRIEGQIAANSNPFSITLPVVDPNYFFLRRFRTALASEGINLGQTTVGTGTSQQELAAVQSPPMSQLIAGTNLESNNLYAESLLRALAVKQARKPNQTTVDVGMEVLRKTLTQLGVDEKTYLLNDGSGLSRRNFISPEALVQTLRGIGRSSAGSIFRASLPVAGRSGTLKNRFKNTPAEGIVQAKTGTMTGVVALAGYVNAPRYEPIVFSIIVNHSDQPASVVRQAIDEVVVLLTQLQKC
jgi:serine-type D-Ala-D-Ala carboxypeptidase/endopeptidase (penicillin-binding protein 4)